MPHLITAGDLQGSSLALSDGHMLWPDLLKFMPADVECLVVSSHQVTYFIHSEYNIYCKATLKHIYIQFDMSIDKEENILTRVKLMPCYIEAVNYWCHSHMDTGRVVWVLDLKSVGPGFKSSSDHYLVLFLGNPEFNSSAAHVNSQLVYQLGSFVNTNIKLNDFFVKFNVWPN